jgi:hypothetical protein
VRVTVQVKVPDVDTRIGYALWTSVILEKRGGSFQGLGTGSILHKRLQLLVCEVLVCEGKLATADEVPQVQLTAGFIAADQIAGTCQGFHKCL